MSLCCNFLPGTSLSDHHQIYGNRHLTTNPLIISTHLFCIETIPLFQIKQNLKPLHFSCILQGLFIWSLPLALKMKCHLTRLRDFGFELVWSTPSPPTQGLMWEGCVETNRCIPQWYCLVFPYSWIETIPFFQIKLYINKMVKDSKARSYFPCFLQALFISKIFFFVFCKLCYQGFFASLFS